MKKQLYEWIFFRLMGWKIEGSIDPAIKKCVMMVMPHTSAHDFYLGIFTNKKSQHYFESFRIIGSKYYQRSF